MLVAEKNAKLAPAAPELLEVAELECQKCKNAKTHDIFPDCNVCLVGRAIRKAKGL